MALLEYLICTKATDERRLRYFARRGNRETQTEVLHIASVSKLHQLVET
jgi:succinate dehydrogenase flavin-adding protein (antitoxin of CptAB toxin-antitoxin module)